MATAKKIVRALDLGWGYTKYSHAELSGESLGYSSFPSLAPRAAALSLGEAGALGRRNTVQVLVEGTRYEVGPDSADLDTGDATRNLNDQYLHTEQYKALFYGALAYINEPAIDLLVLGLPLSNMQAAPKLKAMAVGEHNIDGERTVLVRDALVLPQPLGGLHYCLSLAQERPEFEFLAEEVNLVIDPGFLTFDFLLARGERPIETRSGANSSGVSRVLRAVAESISTKFGVRYDNLSAVDLGLRRRKLKVNGVVESLDEHIRNTRSVLEGPVNFMKNLVGDGSDIDNIILLGGGAHVYQRTIASFFPNHKPVLLEDAQLANVRGFQLAGERWAARKSG